MPDASRFTSYTFKPQLKVVGKKYGKQVGEIRAALAELSGSAAKKELDETGSIALKLPSGEVKLTEEELLIETAQTPGYESASDRGVAVVLDTTLTDALIEEGFVRELISKIQSMRKDAGFEVLDHIRVYQSGNDRIKEILTANRDAIAADVLADDVRTGETGGFTAEWNINGESTTLGVEVIK